MIDTIIVAGYLATMLIVGWRSRRQSADSFWVAERRHGTRQIALSLVATVFGASSTLGIVGLGYSRGLTGAWWSLIGAVGILLFGFAIAARVRALQVYTLPDILHDAYGKRVSVSAGIMIVVAWCGIVAAQMIAGARLLSEIVPLEYRTALTVIAAVFMAYSYWGGQLSVIRTDAWQLTLFIGGLAACTALAMVTVHGGTVTTVAAPPGHFSFPVSETFSWYDLLIFYPLIVGLPYLVGPDIYSRVFCARDSGTAKKAALTAGFVVVPVSFLLAALGILIRVQFPDLSQDAALPVAIKELAPVGLTGLITAGFLAAVMSSADTTLVSAATIFSLNVVGARKQMTRTHELILTRAAVLGVGMIAWLIAGFQRGIIPSLLLGYTVFVGGVVFPTLASFLRAHLRVTGSGAMWSVIVGGTAALLGGIKDGDFIKTLLGSNMDALLTRILGFRYPSILPILLSVTVLLTVSHLQRSTRKEPDRPGENR